MSDEQRGASTANGPVIDGVGTHVPRDRLSSEAIREAWGEFEPRGIEGVAVASADEDSLTMAVSAARRAINASTASPDEIEGVWFATTTPPLEEESLTPRLCTALGVAEAVRQSNERGDTRAGTAALIGAVESPARPALVVAADAVRGEPSESFGQAAGAAGAAVVVRDADRAGGGTGRIRETATHSRAAPGSRFRRSGETATEGFEVRSYDRAAFCEPAVRAVERLDASVADTDEPERGSFPVDALATTAPDADRPRRLADALGIDPARLTTPVASVGDTGAAGPLLGLAWAARTDRERTLLVGVGSGGLADAVAVAGCPSVVADDRPTRRLSYADALRRRETITGDPPAGGGARVSVPTWRRRLATRYQLRAGRCRACGAVSFPGEGACRACHELVDYEPVRLPREGTVVTATGIAPAGAPPEFVPQTERDGGYPVAIVRFGREDWTADVPLQVTDAEPGAVEAGDTVRVVFRLIDRLDGLPRYGAKARLVSA